MTLSAAAHSTTPFDRLMAALRKLEWAVLILALWPCASLLAQDYEIRLHRPQVVGQKYRLSATGRSARTQVVKSGDKILRNDSAKFAVEFEGAVTVLAVDDRGKPSKLSLEIEKLSRTDDAGSKELVSKGSVVTVSMKDGAEVSETDGHLLSQPTQEAITVILPLYPPNGPTADELFGTNERKKPGDHWDANTEMAKDILRLGATARKEDLSGTVTFEKVVKVGKTECLQISGSMDCSRYVPDVPRGMKAEKGILKIGFSEKLPVAASMPALELTQSSNVSYTMKGRPDPTGDEMTIDVGGVQTSLSRVTDVQEPAEAAPK
jgi:hypothetical protein